MAIETADQRAQAKPRRRMRPRVLWVFALPCIAATIVGFFGHWHWLIDLAAHARVQYAAALGGLALLAALMRAWGSFAAFAMFASINTAMFAPLWLPDARETAADATTLRIVHFNVHTANGKRQQVGEFLESTEADLVFVHEVNAKWVEILQQHMASYDLAERAPRDDNFGGAAFVKKDLSPKAIEIVDTQIVRQNMRFDALPMVQIDLQLDGRPISVLGVHTLPPIRKAYHAEHVAHMRQLAAWSNARTTAPVIIGDLNATPWAAAFRELVRDSDLLNSQQGHGIDTTWPSTRFAITAIPIDHCLHHRSLVTTKREVGPSLGSDHRSLIVELTWAAQPPAD